MYSYIWDGNGVVLTDDDTGEDVYMQGDEGEDFIASVDGDYDGYCDDEKLEELAPHYFAHNE